jgi:glutathione S-transferase
VTEDGAPLTEVLAILFYLARRFPEAGLLPAADPLTEAQALSWMSFVAAFLHPARTLPIDRAIHAWAVAEARLGAAEWALGERYSIADIHLFRLFWRFRTSREPPPGCLPRLEAHEARVMARPAVARAFAAEAAIGYHLPP